jgi:glutamine synthetase
MKPIYTVLEDFRKAAWTSELLGADVKARYADLKQASADRRSRLLGPHLCLVYKTVVPVS